MFIVFDHLKTKYSALAIAILSTICLNSTLSKNKVKQTIQNMWCAKTETIISDSKK